MTSKARHLIYKTLIDCLRCAEIKPLTPPETYPLSQEFVESWLPLMENAAALEIAAQNLNKPKKVNLREYFVLSGIIYQFPKGFLEDIEKAWNKSPEWVIGRGVAPLVNKIPNVLIGEKLTKIFGDKLDELMCFYRQPESKNYQFIYSTKDYPRGIVVPILEGKMITDLKIYRSVNDRNSFALDGIQKKAA